MLIFVTENISKETEPFMNLSFKLQWQIKQTKKPVLVLIYENTKSSSGDKCCGIAG